jgi:hypothetical protein
MELNDWEMMAVEAKGCSKCLVCYNPNKLLQGRMALESLEGRKVAVVLKGSTE